MDSYEVSFSFQRSCDGFNHTNTTTVAGNTRQYTLTGLQEFSNYTVTVVAVNGSGRSEESKENVVTMADGTYVNTMALRFPTAQISFLCISLFPFINWFVVHCEWWYTMTVSQHIRLAAAGSRHELDRNLPKS